MSNLLERQERLQHGSALWGVRRAKVRPSTRELTVRVNDDARWVKRPQVEESLAVSEATRLLDRLDISQNVRQEVRRFMTAVAGRDAPVPSVGPGEERGDVTLYWKTGPTSMEVEITANGAVYLWARDETGEIHCIEDDQEAIVRLAQPIVLRMATRARQYNPRWRELYALNE